MENPIKMDDLGVPLFSETSIYVVQFSSSKRDYKSTVLRLSGWWWRQTSQSHAPIPLNIILLYQMGWYRSAWIMYINCLPLAISSSSSAPKTHSLSLLSVKNLDLGSSLKRIPSTITNMARWLVTNKTTKKTLAAKIWGRIKHDEFVLVLLGVWLDPWPVRSASCFSPEAKLWTTLMCNRGLRKCAPACCEWKIVSRRSACEFAKWRCSPCTHTPNFQTYCPLQNKFGL